MRPYAATQTVRTFVGLSIMLLVACGGSDATDGPGGSGPLDDGGLHAPLTDAGGEPPATDAGVGAPAPSDHLTEQVVGAAGGTVTTSTGVTVEIPAGALPGDVTITIDEVSEAPLPSGATSLGKTIQFGPEGQTFASPVKVKLPWSGPNNVPVEIAHAPRGGSSWTALTENTDFDATHVWAETSSFSWFQPVVYQGAPDTPIILDKDNPTGWTKLLAVESTPQLSLRGTGFRGDTIVKLYKDGVPTTTVSPVTLTKWGLALEVPSAFTATLGLITIEAKNPQASVGDAAAVYVVKTPVLKSLSPSTVNIDERDDNNYTGVNVPVSVNAVDLPDDLSFCEVDIFQVWGRLAALVASTTAPTKTEMGIAFTVTDWYHITGESELRLLCRGVISNTLPITFNLVGN
jgi:hypothetical protein